MSGIAADGQQYTYRVLDTKVIAVAKTRIPNEWVAYIKDVPGNNHELEVVGVMAWGSWLSPDIAKAIFPGFAAEMRKQRRSYAH